MTQSPQPGEILTSDSGLLPKAGETWRNVPGYPNYRVSDAGRVIGPSGKVLRAQPAARMGYLRVSPGPAFKPKAVHHLVASAFIGPRPDGMFVGHVNGNPTDNRAENLCYITPAENCAHMKAHGTAQVGDKNHRAKLRADQASEIKRLAKTMLHREVAAIFNVSRSTVSDIAAGRSWGNANV